MNYALIVDAALFLITYIFIAIGKVPGTKLDRTAIALIGGIAAVAFGRLSFASAAGHLDMPTLALLFSLMILSGRLQLSGFYTWVVQKLVRRAHQPWVLLIATVFASAGLSALFTNDVICLAFAPILCVALRHARRNAMPYLIALATSANIGSAATLIGNPQNILIGQAGHLSFARYSAVAIPLVLLCLILNVLGVAWVYRKTLFAAPNIPEPSEDELAMPPPSSLRNSMPALILTVVLVAAFLLGLPREIVALAAAGLLLISRKYPPRDLLACVDWPLLLLFVGLFVIVGNARDHQLFLYAYEKLNVPQTAFTSPWPLSILTLGLSNLVSNVPAVLLLIPSIPPENTHTWDLLAVISTFAGNLTLLGSIANLIVAEQARKYDIHMGFMEYLKAGLPITLATSALAAAYFSLLK